MYCSLPDSLPSLPYPLICAWYYRYYMEYAADVHVYLVHVHVYVCIYNHMCIPITLYGACIHTCRCTCTCIHMCVYMCAFFERCAVTWDVLDRRAYVFAMTTLINDVIFCIPPFLATVLTTISTGNDDSIVIQYQKKQCKYPWLNLVLRCPPS